MRIRSLFWITDRLWKWERQRNYWKKTGCFGDWLPRKEGTYKRLFTFSLNSIRKMEELAKASSSALVYCNAEMSVLRILLPQAILNRFDGMNRLDIIDSV